jgi:hypothetical protein
LQFDSSWRPEFDDDYHQSAEILVSFDGGEPEQILRWVSDPGDDDFHDDNSTDELIELEINNPAGSKSMTITFGMFDAGNDWWWAVDNIAVTATGNIIPLPTNSCDFDNDGMLGIGDIDLLLGEVKAGTNNASFDITKDGIVNSADIVALVEGPDKLNTYIGDANLDGEFNSSDFVTVFTAAKYESGNPATWGQGDWNGDGLFNSSDFVAAFTSGGYEKGPRTPVVPEPSGIVLLSISLFAMVLRRARA